MNKSFCKKVDKKELPLFLSHFPTVENIIKLFSQGFGGIFPLAISLIAGKFMQKKLIYVPEIEGSKNPDENGYPHRNPKDRGF